MFSSSQIIALVLVVALTVVVVVLTQKAVKVIKEKKLQRAEAVENEEMQEAITHAKASKFITSDGLVEGFIRDHDIEWVALKGKKRWDSFEDLLNNEDMPLSTYEEVIELRDSLKEVQKQIKEEMYTPKFYVTHDTSRELGRDLVVYRHGSIRMTNRLMVMIGEIEHQGVNIVRAAISYNSLDDTSKTVYDLDFTVTDENLESDVEANLELLNNLINRPEFHAEKKEYEKVVDNLIFYNECISQKKVTIKKGRVYAHAIAPLEEITEPVIKSDLSDLLKTAIDARCGETTEQE